MSSKASVASVMKPAGPVTNARSSPSGASALGVRSRSAPTVSWISSDSVEPVFRISSAVEPSSEIGDGPPCGLRTRGPDDRVGSRGGALCGGADLGRHLAVA